MDQFALRDGVLHAEDIPLPQIAEEIGTPVYVYSRATLERHARVFREALAGVPDKLIAFAVKSNPNLAVLKVLGAQGMGADVVSVGFRLSTMPRAKDGTSVGTESSETYSSILIKKEEAYLIATFRFLLSKVDLFSLIELVFFFIINGQIITSRQIFSQRDYPALSSFVITYLVSICIL